ncbi:hypothetical protein C0971_07910 [Bacillus methanolicus]|nr:hypothetical protein C0971_07910 [Bacillus methanolicus]
MIIFYLSGNEMRKDGVGIMIEKILDFALGPYGRMIGDLYVQYQMPINTIVVGLALASYFKHKKQSHQSNVSAEATGGHKR